MNTTDANLTQHAIHEKIESQMKRAEAKLDLLKAQAESAKANVEIKTIAELLTKKPAIHQKPEDLKRASGDRWEHAKADLKERVAAFEGSVQAVESRVKH